MAFLDYKGESDFFFKKDIVFDAICKAIPSIDGMKIISADKITGRLMIKARFSLSSWGEIIVIQSFILSETQTKVQIISSPKIGMILGIFTDFGKNLKNIERIFLTTSKILSSKVPENIVT